MARAVCGEVLRAAMGEDRLAAASFDLAVWVGSAAVRFGLAVWMLARRVA